MRTLLHGLVPILLALFAAATASGQAPAPDYGQLATIRIWDNASAPHSNGLTAGCAPAGRMDHSYAELYLFPADPTRNRGLAVVICPGGGYEHLAMTHEGSELARWFAENGVTAAVLKYRMPCGHREVPLEDVEQALGILGGLEAGETGYTPDRVGIVGCSAGGHLAAMASTMGGRRPAFAILFYPVITGEEGRCHRGSFDHLLGGNRTEELTERYSLQHRVTEQTPPTLLLLSDDDTVVPPVSSIAYYDALKRHGIRASMHIYPSGGHGWGARPGFEYADAWREAVLDWLDKL